MSAGANGADAATVTVGDTTTVLVQAGAGAIVNLTDVYAERPLPGHPVYCMAKAALAAAKARGVLQDPTDYRIAYSESQDGNIVRVDRVTGETISIRPQPPAGETYRWHWDTPIMLSPHDPKVVYAAANRVFRSTDRGLSWTAVSEDLTDGQKFTVIRKCE